MSTDTVEVPAAETSAQALSVPSEDLVRHAVRPLDWDERLVVTKMSAGPGNTNVDVYSFPDAVNTLFGTRWDRLEVEATKANIIWVDAKKLADWLRDVIGDVEFGDAVEASLDGADHFKAQIEAMFPIFKERVAQYQAVLRADDGPQDEDVS